MPGAILAIFYPGCIAAELLPALKKLETSFEIHYSTPEGNELPEMAAVPKNSIHPFAATRGSIYKLVLVPGGDPGSVIENSELRRILHEADAAKALIGAVCAGPSLLDKAQLLTGKRVAHGYLATQIKWLRERGVFNGCDLTDELFVQSGRIFTAKPEGTPEFTDAIVNALKRAP